MAQRKSSPSGKASSGKPGAAKTASGSSGAARVSTSKPAAKTSGTKPAGSKATAKPAAKAAGKSGTRPPTKAAAKSAVARKNAGSRPPTKRKPKSIVNQKQTPWGLLATTLAVVVFAAAVVIVVVLTHKSSSPSKKVASDARCTKVIGNSSMSYLNELVCAKDINGVTFTKEPNRNHVDTQVKYDSTPPVGGNHNSFWADCTGTIYSKPIANENAVHMLEHGAIWITYNADTLPSSQLDELKSYVAGNDQMALSPYPNLKTPISLQAWGYQLFVKKSSDSRIARFIAALKVNKATTPEYGASCSNPAFKKSPSTFGHPKSGP